MRAPPYAFLALPNLLTYISIGAGSWALLHVAGPSDRALAGLCIGVSAIADAFDGRFARLFPRNDEEQRFGGQIDSLSDAVAFGVVPPLCLYRVVEVPAGPGRWVWLAAGLFYSLCAITRLAYFNLSLDDEDGKTGFVGIPTTLLGLCWALFLLVPVGPWPTAAALVLGGVAMVSSLKLGRPSLGLQAFMLLLALVACVVHTVRLVA